MRFGMWLLALAMAAAACSSSDTFETRLSDNEQFSILELQRNTTAWGDVPDTDWFELAETACATRGWERDRAIALAQEFINDHPADYNAQPSQEVAGLVFAFTTAACRNLLPGNATPPGSVDLKPR